MCEDSDIELLEKLATELLAKVDHLEATLAERDSKIQTLQTDLEAIRLEKLEVGQRSLSLLRKLENILTRRVSTDRPGRRSERLEELLAARRLGAPGAAGDSRQSTVAQVKLCSSELTN